MMNTKAYPQSQFLILMQALESLHRKTRPGTYVRPEKYKKYRGEIEAGIPEVVPPNLRKSIKDALNYGNEYSLRERIEELLTLYPGKQIIDENPELIGEIVSTRHNLSHGLDRKKKTLKGPALLNANERLRFLLTSLLLRKLEIHEATISEAVGRIQRLEYFSPEDEDLI
jgi:hypothetical protein